MPKEHRDAPEPDDDEPEPDPNDGPDETIEVTVSEPKKPKEPKERKARAPRSPAPSASETQGSEPASGGTLPSEAKKARNLLDRVLDFDLFGP